MKQWGKTERNWDGKGETFSTCVSAGKSEMTQGQPYPMEFVAFLGLVEGADSAHLLCQQGHFQLCPLPAVLLQEEPAARCAQTAWKSQHCFYRITSIRLIQTHLEIRDLLFEPHSTLKHKLPEEETCKKCGFMSKNEGTTRVSHLVCISCCTWMILSAGEGSRAGDVTKAGVVSWFSSLFNTSVWAAEAFKVLLEE